MTALEDLSDKELAAYIEHTKSELSNLEAESERRSPRERGVAMTTVTLAEIKDAIAQWDDLSPLEKKMHYLSFELSPDDANPRYVAMLRALLPVVEAAVALTTYDFLADEFGVCSSCDGKAIRDDNWDVIGYEHKPNCRIGTLTKALAALK